MRENMHAYDMLVVESVHRVVVCKKNEITHTTHTRFSFFGYKSRLWRVCCMRYSTSSYQQNDLISAEVLTCQYVLYVCMRALLKCSIEETPPTNMDMHP